MARKIVETLPVEVGGVPRQDKRMKCLGGGRDGGGDGLKFPLMVTMMF